MSAGKPIRVFLSSTWEDLQPERHAVEKALHRTPDTAFGGMEYFGSHPETTREVSLAEVDRSHVYIGIFAHRYGSGITEAEYRRARERGIPCLIYLKHENVPVPPAHVEPKPQKARRLESLKRELKEHHTVSFFQNPDSLATQVVADLHKHLDSAPTVVEEEGKPLPKEVTEEPEGRPVIGCSLTVFLSLIVSIAACVGTWLVVPEVRQLLPLSWVTPTPVTPIATLTATSTATASGTATPVSRELTLRAGDFKGLAGTGPVVMCGHEYETKEDIRVPEGSTQLIITIVIPWGGGEQGLHGPLGSGVDIIVDSEKKGERITEHDCNRQRIKREWGWDCYRYVQGETFSHTFAIKDKAKVNLTIEIVGGERACLDFQEARLEFR